MWKTSRETRVSALFTRTSRENLTLNPCEFNANFTWGTIACVVQIHFGCLEFWKELKLTIDLEDFPPSSNKAHVLQKIEICYTLRCNVKYFKTCYWTTPGSVVWLKYHYKTLITRLWIMKMIKKIVDNSHLDTYLNTSLDIISTWQNTKREKYESGSCMLL